MDAMILANKGSGLKAQRTTELEVSENLKVNRPQIQISEQVVEQATYSGVRKIEQTQEQVIADLQKAINAIQGPKKSFEISVHEKTNAIMIKVLNKETGDLIREVPPEKILDLAARMMEITGIIIDKKI